MLFLLLLLPLLLVKLLLNHQLLYFGRLPPRSRLEFSPRVRNEQRRIVCFHLEIVLSREEEAGGANSAGMYRDQVWRQMGLALCDQLRCDDREGSVRVSLSWRLVRVDGYLDNEQVSKGGYLQRGPFLLCAEDEEHEVHKCHHSAEAVM